MLGKPAGEVVGVTNVIVPAFKQQHVNVPKYVYQWAVRGRREERRHRGWVELPPRSIKLREWLPSLTHATSEIFYSLVSAQQRSIEGLYFAVTLQGQACPPLDPAHLLSIGRPLPPGFPGWWRWPPELTLPCRSLPHAATYAMFAWLLMLLALPVKFCKPTNLAMPAVIAGVYGIAMQMVEVNVPGLPTEVLGVFTDIGGAILSIAVMVRIWPRIKRLGRAAAAQL